jgi:hypothetical protein
VAKGDTDLQLAMKHKYRVVPDGAFVPGVTTVIGIIEKPAFKWTSAGIAAETAIAKARSKRYIVPKHRKKLAAYRGESTTSVKNRRLANMGTDNDIFAHFCRGEFDRQWKEKAARGNRVHDIAERWTRGEAVNVRDDESRYVDALETFHKDFKPVFHLTECVVLNDTLGYGGRFDTIATFYKWDGTGRLRNGGGWVKEGTYLVDYKTGGEYEDSVAMQTIGYMRCGLPTYDELGRLQSLEPLPELDGARIVYLNGDGTYKIVDPFAKISEELAWDAFVACLRLWKANKEIQQLLKAEDYDND